MSSDTTTAKTMDESPTVLNDSASLESDCADCVEGVVEGLAVTVEVD